MAPEALGGAVRIELAAAALLALVPAWLFAGPLGPFRAPGLEGEGLYGQLFAGALTRRWLIGAAAPGVADVAGGAVWWPVSPLGAGLQAVLPVDPAFALGLVVALGVWLAGYGPWRLARRVLPAAPVWGALCAALAAQTSPVVLRAVPAVDLAALAVGAIALGLAHPRLAWVGGLWSAPGAVVFGVAGLFGRRLPWLLAAAPALALALPASTLPAAMRPAASAVATSPAYVTKSGATFPLPPGEQTAVLAAAQLTRTGLWIPAEVSPLVRGNLFMGPPPTPGTGREGEPGSWGGAPPRNAPPGGAGPLDPQPGVTDRPGATPAPTEGYTPLGTALPGAQPVPGTQPMAGVTPGVPPAAPEGERPWIGGLFVPLQRLHGGAAAIVGLLAALLLGAPGRPSEPDRNSRTEPAEAHPDAGCVPAEGAGPRPVTEDGARPAPEASSGRREGFPVRLLVRVAAAGGLAAVVGLTLVFGWQAAPGEAERDAALTAGLRLLLDADQIAALPGGGALAWAALLPVLGGLGIAAIAGVSRVPLVARVAVCVALVGLGVPLENPRLVAPVASVPPDPVRQALAQLPSDRLLLFPAPQWPYLQGQRPAASVFWEAAATGQRVEASGEEPAAAALVGALTALTSVPVDVQAARLLWSSRGDEPLRAARAAGWRYLLVDLEGLPPLARPRVDGWLAERAGMPVARDGSRLLYDLAEGPAGAP